MKPLFVFILFVMSQSALAAVEFQSNTVFSSELQEKIAQAVAQACPVETRQGLRIVETATAVRTLKIDQGMSDQFYSTVFSVHGTDAEGYHPRAWPLLVESAVYSLQNGDSREVRLVYGCEGSSVDAQCISNQLRGNKLAYRTPAEIHQVLIQIDDHRREPVVQAAIDCKKK